MHRRRRPIDQNGQKIDLDLLAELEQEEPLSIAEELDKAAERVRRVGAAIARDNARDQNVHIAALQQMSISELIKTAEDEKVPDVSPPRTAPIGMAANSRPRASPSP